MWVEAKHFEGQLALLQEVTATPRVEVMWKARKNSFASLIVPWQLDVCLSVTTIASADKLLLCAKRDRNVGISARGWSLVLALWVIYERPWLRCSNTHALLCALAPVAVELGVWAGADLRFAIRGSSVTGLLFRFLAELKHLLSLEVKSWPALVLQYCIQHVNWRLKRLLYTPGEIEGAGNFQSWIFLLLR